MSENDRQFLEKASGALAPFLQPIVTPLVAPLSAFAMLLLQNIPLKYGDRSVITVQ
jgi:hypothetical protein